MEDILSLNLEELIKVTTTQNQPKFRAEQLFYDLHNGKAIDEITTLPKQLKDFFKNNYITDVVSIFKQQVSKDGTIKFLFKLFDQNLVEGVLMNYKFGKTLCISTQVGCAMGCKFCASTIDGLVRNLTAGEILGQILCVNKFLGGTARERLVTNIVLMGSGEPLTNFDNFIKFLNIVTHSKGICFGDRNISISTCGISDKIIELADSGYKINLCLSLHASNNNVRKSLMPIAQNYTIKQVIAACQYYIEKTKRRLLVEYILIDNVNASARDALELAKLLKGINCIVNLINLNEVVGKPYKRVSTETQNSFANILLAEKINVTTRRSLGNDIDGACGQLRRRVLKNEKIDNLK